jgi:class 3 adenylate cyclase/tetratricopeptide (TPR) repeat protein
VTERRYVSVLFADLVGFTTFSDDRDPEAVREFLDRYFELARERIARYGGTIEKFIGDAVMAVWGTPVTHEDDAERAVRAAVELLDGVGGLRAPDGSVVMARCAVVTGEAAVTLNAEGQGMVAGDLVNTASRLQASAPAGSVLVSEATRRASESAIAYELVGELALRGKELPIPAWRATRVVAGRGGYGRSTRLEAPFVGRDEELRLLKELLHATARDRRARLVSVLGIAGIGKSRLAWELEKYIDGLVELVYWHQGRSPAYGDGLAYWALAEMVRGRARIAESDPPDVARSKLGDMTGLYLTDPVERARVEPHLAALLGLGGATGASSEELTAAWRTLFERIADLGPTVLVFEDLHWADPGLLDFIEGLLASARNRPITVLALAHPELLESRPTFGAAVRNHTRLDLAPLTDDAMDTLLLGLVPGIPPAAIRAIRERAAGIPLYAVETVRMLLDQGRLSEADGRFRLDTDLGTLAVPDSLQSLIGARLDTLDERARQLLGVAAVLGLSSSEDAMAAVSGMTPETVRSVLAGLVGREILVLDDDAMSPERGQYRFIQGVLREVAYGRIARRDRSALHVAAAAHFQHTGGEELAGLVATQYLSALQSAPDDAERAALLPTVMDALEAAADRSRAIGAQASAAGYLADAVELASDDETRLRLDEQRAEALLACGRIAEAVALAKAIVDEAFARDEHDRAAKAASILTEGVLFSGGPQEAVELVSGIRARLGDEAARRPDAIRLAADHARALLMSSRHAEALELIDATLPFADRSNLREVVAQLLASRGWAIAAEGRGLEALAVLRGALVLAEREGFFNAEMRTRMNLSAFASGESPAEALEVAWAGAVRARERGNRAWATTAASNATDTAILLGRWDLVEEMVPEIDPVEEWTSPLDLTLPANVAAVRAYRGRTAEARQLLDRFANAFPVLADPQIVMNREVLELHLALATGDPVASLRHGQELDLVLESLGITAELLVQAVPAVEAGDRARLARIVELSERSSSAGRLIAWQADVLRGVMAVMAGDLEGLARIDQACTGFRTDGIRFSLALALMCRVLVAPDAEGAADAASEARTILRELGAVTLLRGPLADPAASTDPPPASSSAAASRG